MGFECALADIGVGGPVKRSNMIDTRMLIDTGKGVASGRRVQKTDRTDRTGGWFAGGGAAR
eukprot:2132785-Pyramimonas_sp.AAC.1